MCYDQECKKAQWDLDTIIFINHLIAAIHAKQMEGFFTGTDGLKKTKEWISYRRMKSVSPQLKALLAFVKGVGTVHASEPSVAAELFDYAMELYPDEHVSPIVAHVIHYNLIAPRLIMRPDGVSQVQNDCKEVLKQLERRTG